MVGTVTIQWCPNCKVWARSKRIYRELVETREGAGREGAGRIFRRAEYECRACGAGFVTSQVRNGAAAVWTLADPGAAADRAFLGEPRLQPA